MRPGGFFFSFLGKHRRFPLGIKIPASRYNSHAHAKQQVSLQLCSCPSLCRRTRDNFLQEIDDSTEKEARERERERVDSGGFVSENSSDSNAKRSACGGSL